ncbi:MAG: lytic transglycosylase domain-containing protein [Lachnospiraceae bacterium]|nr:lytic transglycosylase domain-containing protein [Lachnospiraceae bacterium]
MKRIFKYYITATALTVVTSLLIAMTVHAAEPVIVPDDVKEISEELGAQYDICPETIQSIGWWESRFDPKAENGGCIGIMQINPRWHQDRMDKLGVTDLLDTRQNMTVAVDYLSDLLKEGEDMEIPLMRYHGESRIGERLDAGEMSEYVESVLTLSAELEHMNEGGR